LDLINQRYFRCFYCEWAKVKNHAAEIACDEALLSVLLERDACFEAWRGLLALDIILRGRILFLFFELELSSQNLSSILTMRLQILNSPRCIYENKLEHDERTTKKRYRDDEYG
jgi:hypothetical protein